MIAIRDKRRFNTFFPIYNPGPVPATVTVYFYTEGGNSGVDQDGRRAGPVARQTVWTLVYDELANQKFATFFSSTSRSSSSAPCTGADNKAGHASLGTRCPTTSR